MPCVEWFGAGMWIKDRALQLAARLKEIIHWLSSQRKNDAKKPIFSSIECTICFVLLTLFCWLLLKSTMGPWGYGLTPDAINYVKAAMNLVDEKEILNHDYSKFTAHPAYTLAIAVFYKIGFDAYASALFLNACGLSLTVFYSVLLLRAFEVRWTYACGAGIVILFSEPMTSIGRMLLTESLFTGLSAGFTYHVVRLSQGGKKWHLIPLLLFGSWAPIQRKNAVAFIPIVGIVTYFLYGGIHWFRRLISSLIMMAICFLPSYRWDLHNREVKGGVLTTNSASDEKFSDLVLDFFYGFAEWFFPFVDGGLGTWSDSPEWLAWLMAAGTICVAIYLTTCSIKWAKIYLDSDTKYTLLQAIKHIYPLSIILLVIASQIGVVIFVKMLWTVTLIEARTLVVFYPQVIVLITLFLDRSSLHWKNHSRLLQGTDILACCMASLIIIGGGFSSMSSAQNGPGGYAKEEIMNSELHHWLVDHGSEIACGSNIKSNGPALVHIFTNAHVKFLPSKTTDLEDWIGSLHRDRDHYFVFPNWESRLDMISASSLLEIDGMEKLVELDGGQIIVFSANEPHICGGRAPVTSSVIGTVPSAI